MMKKVLLLIGIFVILIAISFLWLSHESPDAPNEENGEQVASFEDCVRQTESVVMESYPRQCRTESGRTFTEDIGNELAKNDLIQVDSPRPNESISSPLIVKGQARGTWFFEGSFAVRLLDDEGNELAEGVAQAQGSWMTEDFVPFEAVLEYDEMTSETGTLVLQKANPRGLAEDEESLRVPVAFEEPAEEQMVVQAFYSNPERDASENVSCERVFAVNRKVPKSQSVGRVALEELLVGPNDEETQDGYRSQLPKGVQLLSLRIENGTAFADFSRELNDGGGSCRVTGARAQIENTLEQFSSVDDVVISVEGDTEDVLQP